MPTVEKPGMLWSILTSRCPRCRKGKMFHHPNPWKLNKVLSMPEKCSVCGQPFELEPGFYYGTGYVSYGLSVAYLVFTFILWKIIIGMSIDDNRFFWWMGFSIVSLIILQPWLMRLSRVMYLYFFVKYDPDYETKPAVKLD